MSRTIRDAAREAYKAGLSIVPPREDGSKRPIGEWAMYQLERPSKETCRDWWGPCTGLGVVTGAVSGNLEVCEFDDRPVYDAFRELADQAGVDDVVQRLESGYTEDTPSGGVHWLYRCDTIEKNTKLAVRPLPDGTLKTLIETRGEGGYCILAPSNGTVHPSGRPYVKRAGSFLSIPVLTPEDRERLHRVARTFNEAVTPEPRHARHAHTTGGRPGDEFAARASWGDILEPAGWVHVFSRGGVGYWRRPGKAQGISATTDYGGSGLLIVFSSSTPFETGRGYGKFSAYALLHHADDFAEAAKALSARGYGEPSRSKPVSTDALVEAPPPPRYVPIRTALSEFFTKVSSEPPKVVSTPFSDLNWLFNGGFAPGELVFIGARPGVGKTALALELARHAARTEPVLFVSREMVTNALMRRLVAQDGRISASSLRRHDLHAMDMTRFTEALERLAALQMYVTDAVSTLTDIRRLLETPPPNAPGWGVLIVDYLQLVRAPAEIKERRLQVEAVSMGLKGIALKHHLPVVCLTSLRRPQQGNPRPTTADLRESGELEHDADIILLLHRDHDDSPQVEVHVAKNRDGETGTRTLIFNRQFVSFAQAEREP